MITASPRVNKLVLPIPDPVRPRWLGRIVLFVVLSTIVPAVLGVSATASLGSGGTFRVSDVLLPAAALFVLPWVWRYRAFPVVVLLAWFCAYLALLGLAHGASIRWVGRDVRAPLYMALSMCIGLYLITDAVNREWYVTAFTWVVAGIAVLVLASQVTSVALVGQSQTDAIYYGTTVQDLTARRSQIETDTTALVLLAGLVGTFCAGGTLVRTFGGRRVLILLTSSFAILFASYSRNTLLGLGAALAIALVAPVGLRGAGQIWTKLNALVRAFTQGWGVAVALAPILFIIALTGIFRDQIQTYETRVIGGLSSHSLAVDSSVMWRATETRLALNAFGESPVVGDGLGTFYRPYVVGEPFTGDNGRVYMHNYYLWILVRGGVLYAVVMAVVLGGALWRLLVLRSFSPTERDVRLVAACGLFAVLVVAWVAPFPNQTDGSTVVGFVLALAWLDPRVRLRGSRSVAATRALLAAQDMD